MLSKARERQTRFVISQVDGVLRSASVAPDYSQPGPSRRAYATSSSPVYSAVAVRRQKNVNSASVAQTVFSRTTPMVVLPTPLPGDESSAQDSYYFPRSGYVETLNIIDACMFRGHDMPRARMLFDGLRRAAANDAEGIGKVDVAVYNQFIVTYFDLATSCDEVNNRKALVTSAWEIWGNLVDDGVDPDYTTYASLLLLYTRYAVFFSGNAHAHVLKIRYNGAAKYTYRRPQVLYWGGFNPYGYTEYVCRSSG